MTASDASAGDGATTVPRYLPEGWILPAIDEWNRAFFTSGTVALQRCTHCGHVQHPPAELCRGCHSLDFEVTPARPVGTVVAATVVHHAAHPMLADAVPYNVVVVELDDHPGVRITGNVIDGAAAIGDTVECCWATVRPAADADIIQLPQWRRVTDAEG